MSLDVENGMHRLNSESDMEWFARVYALQESRIAELETSLDAMTARAAINGKEGLRYLEALERIVRGKTQDASCASGLQQIAYEALNLNVKCTCHSERMEGGGIRLIQCPKCAGYPF